MACFRKDKELLMKPKYVQAANELKLRHSRSGTKSHTVALIFMPGVPHPPCLSESLFPVPFAHRLVQPVELAWNRCASAEDR